MTYDDLHKFNNAGLMLMWYLLVVCWFERLPNDVIYSVWGVLFSAQGLMYFVETL